jgi:hypothetical protein
MNDAQRVEELLNLSRVEFAESIDKTLDNEFKEYVIASETQSQISLEEQDNSMAYAYNESIPYMF